MPALRASTALAATLLALTLPQAATAPAFALSARPALSAEPSPSTVTVTGQGSATATPDLALIGAGVDVTAKTSKEALAAQTTAANALLDAVRAQGVEERDIRTESLSLSPVYEDQNGVSKLTRYQAAQSFSVKVRDIGKTGAVLQAVTDATGNAGRIHSVAFDIADPAPLHARAREAAHDDAHTKALQYARLSGHRLGRLVSLTEDSSGESRPVRVAAAAFDQGGTGVPVAPGEIRDTITLTAVYELD
ncbi:SIMPL domain-containing protein [Streptomyces sp. NPDC001530]|uniref:SIMPL domain-containing protein n=1 Tax=Streptomyces sp. NPDC001530 TaxID=3364582 RepID=UPI00369AFD66